MVNSQLDHHLLQLFTELMDTGALHKAAERMDLSIAAASRGLQRLREIFNDKLFLKTGLGMTPTPHAQALAPGIRRALSMMESLTAVVAFDPARSTRHFRIAMLDNGIVAALYGLMPQMRRLAPLTSLEVVPLTADVGEQLREGHVDLAIFPKEDLPPDCHRQPLIDSVFACLMCRQHPLAGLCARGQAPRLDDYLKYPRLSVRTRWGNATRLIEHVAMPDLPPQEPASVVPYFLGAPLLLLHTDLVLVMPLPTARGFARMLPLELRPTPISSAPFRPQLIWHDRVHADPSVRWLRDLIVAAVQEQAPQPNGDEATSPV
jgi:DNA-binding transcriptional LysR family regulator